MAVCSFSTGTLVAAVSCTTRFRSAEAWDARAWVSNSDGGDRPIRARQYTVRRLVTFTHVALRHTGGPTAHLPREMDLRKTAASQRRGLCLQGL
jgi:hypothetical protein